MSGQPSNFEELFSSRMQVVLEISKENAEHLRFLQIISGQKVLSMKSLEIEDTEISEQDCEEQLKACQLRIEKLELELAKIDEQINAAMGGDFNNG